jgi:molybdate transport system ATP-binding protein
VSRTLPQQSSVLNALPVRLCSMHPSQFTVLLELRTEVPGHAGVPLLARITRRSVDALALQPGDRLFAQVKGVALMHRES